MKVPNYKVSEFKPIRNNVLNLLLLYMSIGSLPLLATSLFLFYSSGWKASMFIDIVGLLSIPVIYLVRNKISYNLKTGYLIIMGYATGIIVLHDYSFFGTGIIILTSVTLICTLFFGMKTGWLIMAANIVGISAIGLLYKFKYLDYNFNLQTYIESPITWLDHIITFLFFIGIVVIAAGQIHNALLNLIRQFRAEKEKFKGLFNNIQDAIMIYNTDGKILEMNNSLLEMYGVGRNLVFLSKIKEFSILSPDELCNGKTYEPLTTKLQYEAKATRFDDSKEFYIEVMLSPIEYGERIAILANIRDISQRKQSDEALRQSEEKYRSLIESSPAAIFIIQEGKFVYINPSGAKKLGYTSIDELSGKDIFSVLAPEFRDYADQRMHLALNNGIHHLPMEIRVFKKDGSALWAETVSIPIEYYGSTAILIMGFDVSERKKAEELIIQKNKEIESRNFEYAILNQKLKIAKEKAEESDRLKSAFLSNMSHEIRTPMNAILGFSDLLIKATLPEKKRIEYVEIVNSSGNQLLSLINDIIDISKIESNQIVIDTSSLVNIHDVFKQLSVIYSSKAKSKKIHLDYKIMMKDDQVQVYLDEIRLKQILVNLIGNALKFTHHGYVHFEVKAENNEMQFTVEDSGIGIDPEQQVIVFERFRQADGSTTRDYGGTGLGLAISKALVELMGGKIWLQSIHGKGTTFYFTLPFTPSNKSIKQTELEIFSHGNEIWNDKKILVVEDEEINILFLSELLKSSGISILIARKASEAYEIIKQNNDIHLILMDVKIPVVDGYEITKVIKKTRPEIPIIAQTAYALAEERKMILASGFDDYISKPINKGVLLNMITKYLEKHHVSGEI